MVNSKTKQLDVKLIIIVAMATVIAVMSIATILIVKNSCDLLGHHLVLSTYNEATCTQAGSTRSVTCTKCGRVIIESDEIPAKGHEWKLVSVGVQNKYTCTLCGAEKYEDNADELVKENEILKSRVVQLESELSKYTQVTPITSSTYIPQRVEAPAANSIVIGELTDEAYWIDEPHKGHLSSVCMPGTDIQYTILDEKVVNCNGVKINYSTQLRSGTASGERYFYVCDDIKAGEWIKVGSFYYDGSGKEQTITIDFDRYADFEAFCTPRVNPDNSSFGVIQTIVQIKR